MSQQKSVYTRVGYTVDTASIQKAIAANAQYQTSLKTTQGQTTAAATAAVTQLQSERKVLEDLSLAFANIDQRRALDKLAQDAAKGVISTQRLAQELHNISATKAEIDGVTNSIERLQDAAGRDTGGGGLKTGFGTLRAAGSAFGNLGGGQGVTQIASLVGLTVQLGAVGAVAGVAAIALHSLNEETERITAATKARLAVEADLRRALEDATRQDAITARDAAQDALDRANVNLAEAQNARVTLNLDAILGLFTRNVVGGGEQEEYNNTIATQEILVAQAKTQLKFWNQEIDSNTVAVNTATAAQLSFADRALSTDKMTREQREKQIAQNLRDIDILTGLATSSTTTYDAFVALKDQIYDLRIETEDLQSVMTTTADLTARETQIRDAAKETLQQLNDAMKREADARANLADIMQKMTDLDIETEAKRTAANADAEAKRTEITTDGATRRQEIDQQDADRRAEILKQFNRSYGDALGNRDALAAVKAKEQRDDELDKQAVANKRQLEQLDKQMDKQLKAVAAGLEKQARTIQDAYNKQWRTLQRSLDEQNAEIQNAQLAQRTLQAVYNQQTLAAENMHRAAMFKTVYDYGEMTRLYVEGLWSKIAGGAQALFNNGGTVVGGPDSGTYPGSSVGGNYLNATTQQARDRAAAEAQAYREFYARQGMPAQGSNSSSARGGMGVNVVVNTPFLDRASIDRLWTGAGGIRAKLLAEIKGS